MGNSSTFIIVDNNKVAANSLIAMLRQVEAKAHFLKYESLNECYIALSKASGVDNIEGVLFRPPESASSAARFIDYISNLNSETYFIACSESINMEILKGLIQCKVSQILLSPYNLVILKEKLRLAKEFQKRITTEHKSSTNVKSFRSWVDNVTNDINVIYLNGWLGEKCELPTVNLKSATSTVVICCDRLSGLSSIGLRSFLLWIKELNQNGVQNLSYVGVRSFLLNQLNLISDFMSNNVKIDSFYLNYYNDQTDKEFSLCFKRNVDFDDNSITVPSFLRVVTDSGETVFALDEQVDSALGFFKGKVIMSNTIAICDLRIQTKGD